MLLKFSISKSILVFLMVTLVALFPAFGAGNVQPVQAAGVVMGCSAAALTSAMNAGGTVVYGVDCSSTPVVLTSTITISANTKIDGNGHRVTISGGNARRVFIVNTGVTLELTGLTITGGASQGEEGGAVRNYGTLIVKNTSFVNNNSLGGNGGAIFNREGVVEVTNSTFSGNITHGNGGWGMGGALYNYYGVLTITNSTLSGNGAQTNGGGGIFARGKATGNSTLVRNTILHNNQGNNCGTNSATITNGGGNISFQSTSADTSCGAGYLTTDPGLSALGEYDSLMQMFALPTGSPAIDLATANCPESDQRGIPRSTPNCDSGAFEYRHNTTTTVSVDAVTPIFYGDPVTLRATVSPAEVSGMVDFYTGTMKIGSGLLNAGVATYTTTFLSAGTHTITAQYAGNTTYEVSKDLLEADLTVGKAPLTITANNNARLSGQANPTFSFLVEGFKNGESASVFSVWPVCTTTATQDSPIGTYPINCAGGVAQNYSFTYYPGVLTITGHLLTVTPENKTRPYGSDNPVFNYTISGFQAGDDLDDLDSLPTCNTASMTTRFTPVSSNPYPIICSGGSDATYSFAYQTAGLTITPVTVTVTADNQTRKYGAEDPAFTYQMAGFVEGESDVVLSQNPVCVSSANSASPVGGSYTIDCIGAAAHNYTFHYVPGQLAITPAALKITANPQSRPYGTANPDLTVTYTGFANGETAAVFTAPLTCQTTADLLSPVAGSPYPITCSGAAAANYEITYEPAQLTVTRAMLTVKADDLRKGYMENLPTLTYTISGFVNGETAAQVISGAPKLATTATKTSLGGNYPILITIGSLSAANYSFQFEDGVLFVVQFQTFLPVVRK